MKITVESSKGKVEREVEVKIVGILGEYKGGSRGVAHVSISPRWSVK